MLVLIILVMGAGIYMLYKTTKNQDAQLTQKQSEYDALNTKYNQLINDHNQLVTDYNDLTQRYNSLDDKYNKLFAENSGLKSEHQDLENRVNNFLEDSDRVTLYHTDYLTTSSTPKRIVEATAYNVGDDKLDKIIIKCRKTSGDVTTVDEKTFNDVSPLDKRSVRWEYDGTTDILDVWVEIA